MKIATTWDRVCAANQHLARRNLPLHINQFLPGSYEVILLRSDGAYSNVRVGKKMTELQVSAFVRDVVYA